MSASHCPFRDQHPYLTSCGCGYGRRPGSEEDELADLLASASVIHLQPDDQIVIQMDRPLTPELAVRIRDTFKGRQVVVLDQGVTLSAQSPR